jgi:quercetin dioxygenase-like cupin family protein
MPGRLKVELRLGSEQTGGAFCLLVDYPLPGWRLPPHRHQHEAETIHVLEGDFEMDVAGERVRLGPGDTVHIPQGVVHSGGNSGDHAGRRVVLFTPGGIEGFFLAAGAESPDEMRDTDEMFAVANAHGWQFA